MSKTYVFDGEFKSFQIQQWKILFQSRLCLAKTVAIIMRAGDDFIRRTYSKLNKESVLEKWR